MFAIPRTLAVAVTALAALSGGCNTIATTLGFAPPVHKLIPAAEQFRDRNANPAALPRELEKAPLARMSMRFGLLAHAWLSQHRDTIDARADPVVHEALEVAGWDSFLIGAKLRKGHAVTMHDARLLACDDASDVMRMDSDKG